MQSISTRAAFLIGGAIIVAASLVAYGLVHTSGNMLHTHDDAEPTFLYVQNSSSGSLTPNEDTDTWTLTLFEVGEQTVYFSDRPNREVGRQSTTGFISQWEQGDNSFAETPPNAALDIFHADGTQSVLVLELMDATYSEATNTLTYEVILLEGLAEAAERYESFGQSALFIDSTYKHYKCHCELESEEEGEECQCKYEYSLGHGETKEFRVTCTETAQQDIAITHRKKDTTCTIDFSTGSYKTKSCTNWRTSGSDTVTVKAICNDDVD